MTDPIEVLLKFAFLAVLYLFVLWVVRSALRDLRRPVPGPDAQVGGDGFDGTTQARARLIVEQGGGGLRAGEWFEIGSGLTIGRAAASEVRIDDNYASGRHARVYGRDGVVFLEDMSSTNGTYLNGRRVAEPERLRADDRIRIGDAEFRLEA
jgi:hypothetical protein